MVTWYFENKQFEDAWIPLDRINQKKLEYVFRHDKELIEYCIQKQQQPTTTEEDTTTDMIIKDIDLEEEDSSIHQLVQYDNENIYVYLTDTHFGKKDIKIYPVMFMGTLPKEKNGKNEDRKNKDRKNGEDGEDGEDREDREDEKDGEDGEDEKDGGDEKDGEDQKDEEVILIYRD